MAEGGSIWWRTANLQLHLAGVTVAGEHLFGFHEPPLRAERHRPGRGQHNDSGYLAQGDAAFREFVQGKDFFDDQQVGVSWRRTVPLALGINQLETLRQGRTLRGRNAAEGIGCNPEPVTRNDTDTRAGKARIYAD